MCPLDLSAIAPTVIILVIIPIFLVIAAVIAVAIIAVFIDLFWQEHRTEWPICCGNRQFFGTCLIIASADLKDELSRRIEFEDATYFILAI